MKKLLITGSSGMLGSNIALELGNKYDICGIYKTSANQHLKKQLKVDLTKTDEVKRGISKVDPDIVIHCAATTDVDSCEADYSFAYLTNVVATKNIISTLNPKTKFIYISTDSVFDGKKGNYSETDVTFPLNNYAKSKLEGEKVVEKRLKNYAIIRTNIFGWNQVKGTSFAEWVFNSLTENRHIKMFTDVIFSPISANTLSFLIDKLLNKNFAGIINIGSKNALSKYEFGCNLAELFALDKSLISPVSVNSFGFKAKRPKNTSLNVSKADSVLGSLPNIQDELLVFKHNRRAGL